MNAELLTRPLLTAGGEGPAPFLGIRWLNTPDPVMEGAVKDWQSQNTCLHAWKSATNKQFNGLGFYSSSHLPRFEGVWWPVEVGEVTLNGKAARFHFWLQAPWMPGTTKQGFVLCSTETCPPPRGRGHKWCQRRCPSLKL